MLKMVDLPGAVAVWPASLVCWQRGTSGDVSFLKFSLYSQKINVITNPVLQKPIILAVMSITFE